MNNHEQSTERGVMINFLVSHILRQRNEKGYFNIFAQDETYDAHVSGAL